MGRSAWAAVRNTCAQRIRDIGNDAYEELPPSGDGNRTRMTSLEDGSGHFVTMALCKIAGQSPSSLPAGAPSRPPVAVASYSEVTVLSADLYQAVGRTVDASPGGRRGVVAHGGRAGRWVH